jgi:hypothetical protein
MLHVIETTCRRTLCGGIQEELADKSLVLTGLSGWTGSKASEMRTHVGLREIVSSVRT